MGTMYLTVDTIMPYHEEAIGMTWEQLKTGEQLILNATIKGVTMGTYTLGTITLFLLFIPFRRGERWPRRLIPFLWFMNMGFNFWIAWHIHSVTQANTPWKANAIILVIIAIAFLLSGLFVSRTEEQ